MRIYVSADIEGVAGISAWAEASKGQGDYPEFRRQMQAEVNAACEGALVAGATAITVKDAHGSARNLSPGELPPPAQLIRGWSGHPFAMVQDIDETFDALVCIGYHSRAGAGGNPLAHTLSSRKVSEIRLNGTPASEFRLHALAATLVGVPVAFVSGDATLCEEVDASAPLAHSFTTKWGEGASQQSIHPAEAVDGIRRGVAAALADPLALEPMPLEPPFVLEVDFKAHPDAYLGGYYPGAERIAPHSVRLATDDYFEVLRALLFLV